MNQTLSAIVLAGGKSARMGQDKALIPVNGVPLLRRTCEVALECTPIVIVITAQFSQYQMIVPPICHVIAEHTPPHGPLVGFAQGLTWVKTPWILLLACDLPCLQATILQQWMQQLPQDNHTIALLPRTEQGWEPLCGFYHRRCLPLLNSFVEQGGRSFQRWLAELSVSAIEFSSVAAAADQERKMLFNCNTPDDLAAIYC